MDTLNLLRSCVIKEKKIKDNFRAVRDSLIGLFVLTITSSPVFAACSGSGVTDGSHWHYEVQNGICVLVFDTPVVITASEPGSLMLFAAGLAAIGVRYLMLIAKK